MRQLADVHGMPSPAGLLALCALVLPLAGACGSEFPPTSPSSIGVSSPQPTLTRYHLSGRVTTDAGSPIPSAYVYASLPEPVITNFASFRALETQTSANGEYAMEFEALAPRNQILGYLYSFTPGYETNIQWVALGSADLVQNLHLRAIRPIRAGESTSLSFRPESSLCVDPDWYRVWEDRCEVVQVESQAGTLVVDVRAAAGGSVVPRLWLNSGDDAGATVRLGPSTVSIPVEGGTYQFFVGIPDGTATQRFDVVTSLR